MTDWKPGDVARLKGNGLDTLAIRTTKDSWVWVDQKGHNPIHGASLCDANWGGQARRLVVIDPEDRAQVERLTASIYDQATDRPYVGGAADGVQAALREFANPTPARTDEAQGLGDLVLTVTRHLYIRHGNGRAAWMLAGASPDNRDTYPYSEIDAVRVLSDGVA